MRVLAWPGFANVRDNPYNYLLYSDIRRLGCKVDDFSLMGLLLGDYDVWHLHWPERYLSRRPLEAITKSVALLCLMTIARFRQTAIVWTIHNLHSHEQRYPILEKLFWRLFVPLVSAAISLSESGRSLANERLKNLRPIPHRVIPHGHFRDAYPSAVSRQTARQQLRLPPDAFIFLYVGKIRPYKDLNALISTFRKAKVEKSLLLVAGEPMDSRLSQQLRENTASSKDIILDLRHIPSEEIPTLLAAANVVVLPYTDILNSGAALLALSFGRPVMLPNKGSVPELAAVFGDDWVRASADEITVEMLQGSTQWSSAARESLPKALESLNWTTIARETLETYADAVRVDIKGRELTGRQWDT